jgi:hypothetical protein
MGCQQNHSRFQMFVLNSWLRILDHDFRPSYFSHFCLGQCDLILGDTCLRLVMFFPNPFHLEAQNLCLNTIHQGVLNTIHRDAPNLVNLKTILHSSHNCDLEISLKIDIALRSEYCSKMPAMVKQLQQEVKA